MSAPLFDRSPEPPKCGAACGNTSCARRLNAAGIDATATVKRFFVGEVSIPVFDYSEDCGDYRPVDDAPPSVFVDGRPLTSSTCRRIAAGARRYLASEGGAA